LLFPPRGPLRPSRWEHLPDVPRAVRQPGADAAAAAAARSAVSRSSRRLVAPCEELRSSHGDRGTAQTGERGLPFAPCWEHTGLVGVRSFCSVARRR